jgi:Ni,Fe-hydrogenase III small subunit
MIRLYRINTGSCGGCDIEIGMAVDSSSDLAWAASPYEADALLLTGPITRSSRNTLLALLQEVRELPLLAIGRCALDGHPFGRGGVQAVPEITTRLQLDGCPPEPQAIASAIRDVFGYQPPPEEPVETPSEALAPQPEMATPPEAAAPPEPTPEAAAPPEPAPAPEAAAPPEAGELVDEEEDPVARRARLRERVKPLRRPAEEPQHNTEPTEAAADDNETAEGEHTAPPERKKPRKRSSES